MEDFTNFYELEIRFDCIYLDFANAFDRVSHQTSKVTNKALIMTYDYNIGIRGNLINWIKDFLKGKSNKGSGYNISRYFKV